MTRTETIDLIKHLERVRDEKAEQSRRATTRSKQDMRFGESCGLSYAIGALLACLKEEREGEG